MARGEEAVLDFRVRVVVLEFEEDVVEACYRSLREVKME